MAKLTVACNNFAKRLRPLHVAHKIHLCILHAFSNKQRIFPEMSVNVAADNKEGTCYCQAGFEFT
jgi:hypothetical protein